MRFRNGVTAIRLRRRMVEDPYSGEETLGDWSDADRLPLAGVAFAPLTPEEEQAVDARVARNSCNLFGAYGLDITPSDRIEDPSGTEWNVDGFRQDWRNPFTGWEAGSQTRLRRVKEL